MSDRAAQPIRRSARVHKAGFLQYEVLRTRPDGTQHWATVHFTRRGAERAAEVWRIGGRVDGVEA